MTTSFQTMLDRQIAARLETAGSADEWESFLRDREEKLKTAPPDTLPWQAFTSRRLELLKQHGYTVFVDFTAQWCPTCKTNKAIALNTRETREVVDSNNVITLIADMTEESPAANELLAKLGNAAQAIPYYAVFPASRPDEPVVFDGLLRSQQVIDVLEQAGPSKDARIDSSTAMQ
jgi:thiol:disulfide interchange protein